MGLGKPGGKPLGDPLEGFATLLAFFSEGTVPGSEEGTEVGQGTD